MALSLKAQLEQILQEYENLQKASKYSDCSDVLSEFQAVQMQMRCVATVERAVGRQSVYYEYMLSLLKEETNVYARLVGQIAIADALLHDLKHSYLKLLEQ